MRFLIFLLTIFAAGRINAQDLDDYRWKNRIVLLFTAGEGNPAFTQQVEELKKNPEGLNERDLIVFVIKQDRVMDLFENKPVALSDERLRKKYLREDNDFQYILIGKDGGIKLDKREFVPNKYLYAVIDATPMRRQKMRNRY
jgi:hypothetical protein